MVSFYSMHAGYILHFYHGIGKKLRETLPKSLSFLLTRSSVPSSSAFLPVLTNDESDSNSESEANIAALSSSVFFIAAISSLIASKISLRSLFDFFNGLNKGNS
mmetsp:Transcript_28513/g.44910  ORF Transcript_28513/g.44910 Transcript_28513/m.44910 type:complete len:104 (-) Transcript_28513:2971-3282(-)